MAAAAGAAYQFLASWNSRRRFSPPGRLVDIGGHSLHVLEMGQGSPAVVLESGLTATSAVWGWIQPAVAEATRVLAYDRSGIGWSDESPDPHDAATVARHLASLLDRLAVDGPVVLVGHSMGGLFVRVFADLFPGRVAGMVLVDPAHPDQLERFPEEVVRLQRTFMGQLRVAPVLAGLGVAFLSRFSIAGDLAAGRLAPVPVKNFGIRRAFCWALPGGGLSGTSAQFYSFVEREINRLPGGG